MSVLFPENKLLVESPYVEMPWLSSRFITQASYIFHGAVVEYTHPTTNNILPLAFLPQGNVVYGVNEETGDFLDASTLFASLKEIATENAQLLGEGQQPYHSLTDFSGMYHLYTNGFLEDFFSLDTWGTYLTEEDLEDIENRLQDLATFDETEEVPYG